MYLNEISYINNQTFQYQDAQHFIAEYQKKLKWDKEEGIVMDLGCGPGNTTLQLILPSFPKAAKIVAVDLLPNMIDFARLNHSHPKIEYEVANIEDRDNNTLLKWHGKISKIISIHCIHWLKNEKLGFQNIYDLLEQGGEAAIYGSTKSALWRVLQSIENDPKWKEYLKNRKPYTAITESRENNCLHYKKLVEEVGFTVIICEETLVERSFQTDQKCREMLASVSDALQYIPEELKEEFKDDLFQQYLAMSGRSMDGKLQCPSSLCLKLIIKK